MPARGEIIRIGAKSQGSSWSANEHNIVVLEDRPDCWIGWSERNYFDTRTHSIEPCQYPKYAWQIARDYPVSCGHCSAKMMHSQFGRHTCPPEPIVQADIRRRRVQRDYRAWPGYQHVKEYLSWVKQCFSAVRHGRKVKTDWAGEDLDLAGFEREFQSALHLRILLKGPIPTGRNWDDDRKFRLPLNRNLG